MQLDCLLLQVRLPNTISQDLASRARCSVRLLRCHIMGQDLHHGGLGVCGRGRQVAFAAAEAPHCRGTKPNGQQARPAGASKRMRWAGIRKSGGGGNIDRTSTHEGNSSASTLDPSTHPPPYRFLETSFHWSPSLTAASTARKQWLWLCFALCPRHIHGPGQSSGAT